MAEKVRRTGEPTVESKKDLWLRELTSFIVEANLQTWAADGAEVEPQRPGYKELEWPPVDKRGLWHLRDSYTGDFRAPGMTTVYYKDIPVWTQAYGGKGQNEGSTDIVKPTFQFLKEALMRVTPDLPFRGPSEYESEDGEWAYGFRLVNRDGMDATWNEEIRHITRGDKYTLDDVVFTQTGFAGVVIHRTPNGKPQYPWDL